ncbi:MAG TPA: LysE family transporter [Anaerohalosphaeraceae bacterium]|nr:LysE family transporter [Anaerohalosphaeraceae bacterium]HOL88955.1 LysE family transporter [Anaerohalosphaeraceae bacterium]HPP56119.1 LysE family transporter [Anaerohalosphaeraceae bacterium]
MNEATGVLLSFLIQTVVISLSGVMAPGPVTTATLAQGSRNRWAGTLIALGHGILEIPLIFLLMLGFAAVFEYPLTRTAIGITGGLFLIWMSFGMLREIRKPDFNPQAVSSRGPLMTGFFLSATNPYFLFWWVSVGLNLAWRAQAIGWSALVLFAVVHWACDLVWLTILAFSAFYGANLLSRRNQKWILGFCALALAGFGIRFLLDAFYSDFSS